MANLRANKITTGTADYQGSIYASGTGAYLLTTTTAPGTDDFTIECWINSDNASGTNQDGIFDINAQPDGSSGYQSSSTNRIRLTQGRDGTDGQNGGLEVKINDTAVGTGDGNDIIQEGTWHHIAVTRASGTVKIWVDGVEKASGSAAGDVTGTTFLTAYYDGNYTYQGYMSNFRYRKGTAHYTTTFTPPTGPLERTSDTELLFAQSANNAGDGYSSAIHGGTTNIMKVLGNVTANTSAPTLTTTSDVGVVFDGDIKMNSQGHMYFPTGDTAQRGRGRAVFAGGYTGPSPGNGTTGISYFQIQSQGTTIDFGSLTEDRKFSAGLASGTRGVHGGSDGVPGWATGTMEYLTIATTSNTTSFGNMTNTGGMVSAHSNNTRGLFFSVWDASPSSASHKRHIDYITIASAGNGADFGELTAARPEATGFGSPTRGICSGGYAALSPNAALNTIDYVTIATTGDATDFGDLTNIRQAPGGASSETRGITYAGYANPTQINVVDYVTIASTGNATDFGDSFIAKYGSAQGNCSNKIRAVFPGGKSAIPAWTNSISYVDIATTGNGLDFGDLTGTYGYGSVCSDSHGGLS